MHEKLVIHLANDNVAHPNFALIAGDSVLDLGFCTPWETIASFVPDREVWLIVPSEDVLLTTVTLPKMSHARLVQALPFAIEDTLIDELDTLHFALGKRQADESMPVAIVAHKKMQEWKTLLESHAIKADVLIPEALALPLAAAKWQIFISAGRAIVRTGFCAGFACEKTNLITLITLLKAQNLSLPETLDLREYGKMQSPLLASPTLSETGFVINKEEGVYPEEEIVKDLSLAALKAPPLNLLQGTYAEKSLKSSTRKKLWIISGSLLFAWVVLLFVTPILSLIMLNHRFTLLETEVKTIYKNNFPKATTLVAPKLRMQQKLQQLTDQGGNSRLLRLLAFVGKGIGQNQVQLQGFTFQDNRLSLEMTAATSDDISAFTEFLTREGLQVKQQNATVSDSKIKATLNIE